MYLEKTVHQSWNLVYVSLATIGLYTAFVSFIRKRRPAPYPPGPKRLPLIGNVFDLPAVGEPAWLFWRQHKSLYGPISFVEVFGRKIVILNEAELAFDLFEKHYAVYSDRPQMTFGNEIVGYGGTPLNLNYTPLLRAHRKHYHRLIGTKAACSNFDSLQCIEIRRSLLQILENPKNFQRITRTLIGTIILQMAYGYVAERQNPDPAILLAEELAKQFVDSVQPGRWLVDSIYLLKYIPEWFPGATFKRIARSYRQVLIQSLERPYTFAKMQVRSGSDRPSLVATFLEDLGREPFPEEETVMKWTTTAFYGAGSDTSVSALIIFYLAMGLYPEVQRKAREEIESVIGNDRFPAIGDRKSLPYIDAIVKETLRWHPVAPLCIPHAVSKDNVYNGFFIPKGSVVVPNIWEFTHDPKIYHDPSTFKPERFLKTEGHEPELDPHSLAFGFGRRICPGKEFADASLYLNIAMILSVFKIVKPKNSDLKPRFTAAMLSHPEDFEVDIVPISAKAESMIRSVAVEHPFETSDSEVFNSIVI